MLHFVLLSGSTSSIVILAKTELIELAHQGALVVLAVVNLLAVGGL